MADEENDELSVAMHRLLSGLMDLPGIKKDVYQDLLRDLTLAMPHAVRRLAVDLDVVTDAIEAEDIDLMLAAAMDFYVGAEYLREQVEKIYYVFNLDRMDTTLSEKECYDIKQRLVVAMRAKGLVFSDPRAN